MRRGQMGIGLKLFAIAAFACVIFEWTIPLFLVIGYAFIFEKDTWLSQQVVQAGVLYGSYKFAVLVFRDWIFGLLAQLFGAAKAFRAQSAMLTVGNVFGTIFYVAMILLSIWAIVRLCQEKDASVPVASSVAKKLVPGAVNPEI
ncbi:MAG TPA: hypothetical protein GXZ89_05205 [Fastidiosipila sp.]|jgi:hypothetical protein|nr:hypothetical protein [Fastidiosipila sp.]